MDRRPATKHQSVGAFISAIVAVCAVAFQLKNNHESDRLQFSCPAQDVLSEIFRQNKKHPSKTRA
jgi:hypothetical protein